MGPKSLILRVFGKPRKFIFLQGDPKSCESMDPFLVQVNQVVLAHIVARHQVQSDSTVG